AGSVSALMKYSGKTVSNRCRTESVAVMTIRRGPETCSRKGKLADVESTRTIRPGIGFSRAAHSADERSGPTRLNLASVPSNDPCPIRTISSTSSAVIFARRLSRARFTPAAVEACSLSAPSKSAMVCVATNPSFSMSATEAAWRHSPYCSAYEASPFAPVTMSAYLSPARADDAISSIRAARSQVARGVKSQLPNYQLPINSQLPTLKNVQRSPGLRGPAYRRNAQDPIANAAPFAPAPSAPLAPLAPAPLAPLAPLAPRARLSEAPTRA